VPAGIVSVEFWVDGRLVATASAEDAVARWPVQAGRHELQVRAISFSNGPISVSSSFQVDP
jgi:hypothetical protein